MSAGWKGKWVAEMLVYTIMEEVADSYYGYRITELFLKKESRDVRLEEVRKINRGINYEPGIVEVQEK